MPHSKLTLLFDLDGTLVDTDPLHYRAFSMLLAERGGPPLDLQTYRTQIMGFGAAEVAAMFAKLLPGGDEASYLALSDRKEEIFREILAGVEPAHGLLDLLAWADTKGVRRALVTNAPRQNALLVLKALGLAGRFETIVIGEELAHTKPHPLPYLTALAELGVRAEDAMAFEDSISGIRAATGAGIYTVGVRSSLTEQALRAAGASHVVDDFRDAGLWSVLYRQAGERSVQADV